MTEALSVGQFDKPLYKKASDGSVQLPLFATAKEVLDNYQPVELAHYYGGELHRLIQSKQQEADTPLNSEEKNDVYDQIGHFGGLTDKIREHGYDWSKPVDIDVHHGELGDGHHRVAVMLRDRPDEFIPLNNENIGTHTPEEAAFHKKNADYHELVQKLGPNLANIAYPKDKHPDIMWRQPDDPNQGREDNA